MAATTRATQPAQTTIPTPADEQASIEANIISLISIPLAQCPWPAVRSKLLRIAIEGADIYAYRPAHQREYVIWHRQADPAVDARFSPRQWAIRYGYDVDGKEA